MPATRDEILLQTAGFTREDGHVDRPISSVDLFILPVNIDGDDLVWEDNWMHVQFRRPGKGLLSDFLKLHDASPDRVLQFVRKWGTISFGFAFQRVLKSSETKPVTPERVASFARNWIGRVLYRRHLKNRDPIAGYVALSKHVQQILRLARDIEDEQISDSLWETRYPYHCDTCEHGKSAAIDKVQHELNWLIRLGEVTFTLERDDAEDRWRTAVSYGSCTTLGALAVQIVLMASRADNLYTCSGCGLPYIRAYTHRRRPKPNQNNYCDQCGKEDRAKSDAKQRYRRKLQEARRMHAAGIPINRIAEQLDSESERVEKWLREQIGKSKMR